MSGIDDDPTLPDEGRALFDPGDDHAGRVLGGRYTLEERLGVGGGAVVWRAFDESLSRTVAIKVVRAEPAAHGRAVERLRREAATAGRAAHPGVVAVYDTGHEEDIVWLAQEHVDGPTLLDVLRHHPRGLPAEVAAAVAEQTATALGHAHRRGLVHRDVKPSNLLLTADGVVKLADFGVAATVGDDHEPELAGSRGYAPPEQLEGGAGADRPQVDVFALGVVLHECLTGRPAFVGPTHRARSGGELLAPRQVRPDVPRDLDALVRRATRTDPAQRHADGGALAASLRTLVASDLFELTGTLVRTEPDGSVVPAAAPRPRSAPPTSSTPSGPHASRAPDDGRAARDRPQPRGGTDWRWVAVALLVLVATATLATLASSGSGTAGDGPTTVADVGVPVTRVAVFDPYGSLGAGQSDPAAAVDGDPATTWRTPAYPVPLRSLGTPGLGIWIDVGEPRMIDVVAVELETGGITLELLAAEAAPRAGTTEADWRSLDQRVRPGDEAALAAGGEPARYWLLWITELEPTGETWQAAVTDIRFLPATTGTP